MSGPKPQRRPVPDDFEQHVHESYNQLGRRYGAGYGTVHRWIIERGVVRPPAKSQRKVLPVPADYATATAGMSRRAVAKLHGVSEDTAERWDREQQVVRDCYRGGRPRAVKPVRRVSIVPTYMTAPVDRPHLDMSYAGRAAEYLRRFGPVIRCDANGRFAIDGTHWRRGSTLLDAAQIVDRAVRNGFDADAWKRVA